MKVAYLDCFAGCAGDMWVGALLDLGLELSALQPAVRSLGLTGVEIQAQKVQRSSLAGTHFQVLVPDSKQPHRHLSDIQEILARADLPAQVRQQADAVFLALGQAEAKVHDQPLDKVHFHEVGAADTIVDIVCAVLGSHLLGIEKFYASAVVTGRGTVVCDHGEMPVPAPGALGNLTGVPLRWGAPMGECVTPTGAALLKVLVAEFEPELSWVPDQVGYGAGTRDPKDHPNLLRITLGQEQDPGASSALWEVQCNLDTATGEGLAFLLEGLLQRGAVDAFTTPIYMKKGRPAYQVSALVDDACRLAVTNFMLEESTSLGVRLHRVQRQVLQRWQVTVETDLGPVLCKACRLPSGVELKRPEESEVLRLMVAQGLGRGELLRRLLPQLA